MLKIHKKSSRRYQYNLFFLVITVMINLALIWIKAMYAVKVLLSE